MMTVTHRLLLLAATAWTACAPAPKHRINIALLVEGDRASAGTLTPHAIAGLELQPIELPAPPPPPPDDTAVIVTRARSAYAQGDFETCRAELARLDLGRILAAGRRSLAGRAVTFEAACAFGARALTESQAAATRLAGLGLELPGSAVSPDVEAMIGRAIAEAGKLPRHAVAVTGESGGRLTVDGRAAGCAVPCTLDLPAGDHVLAVDTDGFVPASRWIRVPEVSTIELAQASATPELAARQWRARIGRGLPATDAIGAGLMARLAGVPRVVLVRGDTRVTGSLVVDGVLRATAERDRAEVSSLIRDLAYDGGVLRRPTVWQRPWFWIVASGAAVAIAGTIVAVTYEPEVRTIVRFPR